MVKKFNLKSYKPTKSRLLNCILAICWTSAVGEVGSILSNSIMIRASASIGESNNGLRMPSGGEAPRREEADDCLSGPPEPVKDEKLLYTTGVTG